MKWLRLVKSDTLQFAYGVSLTGMCQRVTQGEWWQAAILLVAGVAFTVWAKSNRRHEDFETGMHGARLMLVELKAAAHEVGLAVPKGSGT